MPKAPPIRRRFTRSLGFVGLGLLSATAPIVAEGAARRSIERRFGSIEVGIGVFGLDLSPFRLDEVAITVDRLHIRPTAEGIEIEIDGFSQIPAQSESKGPGSADPSDVGRSPPSEPGWVTSVRRAKGIPIRVETRGEIAIDLGDGLRLRVDSPRADLPGDGSVEVSADLTLEHDDTRIAAASLDTSLHVDAPRTIAVRGLATTRGGATLQVSGHTHGKRALSLDLLHPEGGSARLEVVRRDSEFVAAIDATNFPLDLWPDFETLRMASVAVRDACIDGRAEVHLHESFERGRVHLADANVSGLVVDAGSLSASPITFDELSLTGDVAFDRKTPQLSGDLVVAHGDAQVQLSGEASPEHGALRAELPRMNCQGLADAMPRGFLPVLQGMRFSGDIAGSLELDFAPHEVREAATREPTEDSPPPGRVSLDFPFLESCMVLADAPGVDLSGLSGPYRHHFLTAGGNEHQRIMTSGAEGYVPLARVPRLALAFLILEDSRFYLHDGFDREQIERAMWHNLGVGGIHRGASTISQQTARNLWLGVDRSLGRKLQEAILTARLEAEVPKHRIFELYLNLVELGPEVHGVREAALHHFGREPEELNLMEALHLAAHAPAPVTYSRRFASGTVDAAWRAELEEQVRRLRVHGLISEEEAWAAARAPIRLRSRAAAPT